jgi:eukaryotic-like serine/threonine-protein kinase
MNTGARVEPRVAPPSQGVLMLSMPRPSPSYLEREDESSDWPSPADRLRPVPPATAPPGRRSRSSSLDVAWIVLAALGVAAAAVAAAWYLRLGGGGPPELSVPRVVGLSENDAVRELTSEGFGVRAVEQPAEASPGVVFAQQPRVDARLARGDLVTISVANGETTRNMTGR